MQVIYDPLPPLHCWGMRGSSPHENRTEGLCWNAADIALKRSEPGNSKKADFGSGKEFFFIE